jgi:hypothetical protein
MTCCILWLKLLRVDQELRSVKGAKDFDVGVTTSFSRPSSDQLVGGCARSPEAKATSSSSLRLHRRSEHAIG